MTTKSACIAIVAAAIGSPLFSQEVTQVEYELRGGHLFTAYKGTVSGEETDIFLHRAEEGDSLTIGLIGFGLQFSIVPKNGGEPILADATNVFDQIFASPGIYEVRVQISNEGISKSGVDQPYDITFNLLNRERLLRLKGQ